MRRVLIWVCGHSRAPWLFRSGINAKLLLSAVAYDFYESGSNAGTCIFDCDYLQELCSCLMSVRTDIENSGLDGRSNTQDIESSDGAELVVSLAHYTVMEFLTSPHILQTRIAYFALSPDLIDSEFATSILKQAVEADPGGTATDWARDREAYCLTLGCALNRTVLLDKPGVLELFIQYLTPSNPHFSRFRAIQDRIVLSNDGCEVYHLGKLPARFHKTSVVNWNDHSAEALLNLLLIPHEPMKISLPIIQRLCFGRSIQELLETRLCVTLVGEASADLEGLWFDAYQSALVKFEGTVREILWSRSRGHVLTSLML